MVKKPHSRRASANARGRVLPDDACISCGKTMKESRARLQYPVNGESITVPASSHLKCPNCGEVILRFLEAKRLREDAIAIYRDKHDLLAAEEIRALRKRFALTQSGLARLLHLGTNTVSRWEAGRNVQTEAMDVLLRLLRDVPGNIRYLRERAA